MSSSVKILAEALHNAFENIEHNIDGLGHRERETLYEKPKKNI